MTIKKPTHIVNLVKIQEYKLFSKVCKLGEPKIIRQTSGSKKYLCKLEANHVWLKHHKCQNWRTDLSSDRHMSVVFAIEGANIFPSKSFSSFLHNLFLHYLNYWSYGFCWKDITLRIQICFDSVILRRATSLRLVIGSSEEHNHLIALPPLKVSQGCRYMSYDYKD